MENATLDAEARVEQTTENLKGPEFVLSDTGEDKIVGEVGWVENDRVYLYDRDGREFIVPIASLL
jgi:hypothetical protein